MGIWPWLENNTHSRQQGHLREVLYIDIELTVTICAKYEQNRIFWTFSSSVSKDYDPRQGGFWSHRAGVGQPLYYCS